MKLITFIEIFKAKVAEIDSKDIVDKKEKTCKSIKKKLSKAKTAVKNYFRQ